MTYNNVNPKIWAAAGDLLRYENGVLVETLKYNSFKSWHENPVVLWTEYDDLRQRYDDLLAHAEEQQRKLDRNP